jgi:cytochrome c
MKKNLTFCFAILLLVIIFSGCNTRREGKPRVLLFKKTAGFHHASIPVGTAAIQKLGADNGFEVDTTEDASLFTDSVLQNYSAVVFLNTTGNLFNIKQEIALERYIQGGGGYMGIHAAADAEYDWHWYGRLVGGYFLSHPKIQQATLNVIDKENIATKHLPAKWVRTDEWYNFKNLDSNLKVLVTIDEKSYEGGKNGDFHPMTWYHDFDGGRAFYTEFGHVDSAYSDPLYLKLVLGGIQYAIGKNNKIEYSKAKSRYPPDEDRFTKTVLSQGGFFEPTEISVLPNLDVLISQRRGEILMYKNDTKQVKQVGFLNVYWKTLVNKNVNAEEGLLGLKADPDFAKNHWVYIFYSPTDTSVNRLSRFELKNDTIDNKSEKIILQFYSQREICCHTGGSVAFGPDKNLFVSAGDNSTPFDEPGQPFANHGFGPLDDRPGHIQYDARRSAGNTNDLRGKILRIKVKDDGTYEIPDGNLFPKNSTKARPEIYVMGDRNPYRISVDQKNGFLYWGEVGPDAPKDSLDTRGPRGYDEVNQARKAGFFGWPLFVGNNYPYHQYDYDNGTFGPAFDPKKPVNNSRNNTGLTDLPPVSPAFIWYPYDVSPDFPDMGSGGRTAMAGPVYYSDMFPKETRYPSYYDGKFFMYEWIRGWIKAVTMLPNGDFDKMEPFMEHTRFSAPEDIEVGPDGRLYVLEYGSGWFSKNADAGLSRIDYNSGNRPPKVSELTIDKTSGSLPFKIAASVKAKDPENDKLSYNWDFGDGTKKETDIPSVDYTYTKAGDFVISVEVSDDKKAASKSDSKSVYAGNSAPVVDIELKSNRSFYFPGKPVLYNVKVDDNEDKTAINQQNLRVLADFVEGRDKAAVPPGHLTVSETAFGYNLMMANDCKTCHKVNEKSIGPSFTQVALKYSKDPKAASYLVNKIKKGGSGVWGEVAMPAHPDAALSDLQQIVQYVLSLSGAAENKKSLPASGSIVATAADKGFLYLTASYTDNGGTGGSKPLTAKKTLVFRNSKVSTREVKRVENFPNLDSAGTRYLVAPKGTGSFLVDSVDLTGITAMELAFISPVSITGGYIFELHINSIGGQKIGEVEFTPALAARKEGTFTIPISGVADTNMHNVYLVAKLKDPAEKGRLLLSGLQFK